MSAAAIMPPQSPLVKAQVHHVQGDLLKAAESYRQILTIDSQNQPALLGLSLIARQSGQLQPALRLAQAALIIDPASAIAWTHIGHTLFALRRLSRAEAAFRHALQLNPADLSALIGLAELFTITKRPTEALSHFQKALNQRPNLAAAHYGLGNLHALAEDYSTALASFQQSLTISPEHPESHFATAFAHAKLGDQTRAVHHYRRAVTLRPSFASAWVNLGVSLIADGRPGLAELCYRQASATDPKLLSAHINAGNLQRSRKRFSEARQHYEKALDLQPDNSEILIAFCHLHIEQLQFSEARQILHRIHAIDPNNPEAANSRGILLLAESSTQPASQPHSWIKQAITAFEQAESLRHKTASSNRGNALLRLGRCTEALAAHESATARDPHHPGARYNLALTQLRLGNYAHGWPAYESRWSFREVHPAPRRFAQPRWHGEPLHDLPLESRRVLIYGEQGLGDTLQFVRYMPLIARRGARIILEVQPSLARLLKPLAESLDGQLVSHGSPFPGFAHHCPLMSLPAIFRTTLETVPADIPYIRADPTLASERAEKLSLSPTVLNAPAVLNIGLAWAGNPNYRADQERSTQLTTFLFLLRLPNIRWFSLQKNASAQIAILPEDCSLADASAMDDDLADTAALIQNLDLVISTDTAVAHLTGALGKPLWLLLPWQSDWRWMQDRLDTPWYPTARLFRQSSPNDWTELISRVADALTALVPIQH
ncbi:tetratricopeptide repeat protein [Acidicapsa ligni]|uniref:tetratricopeptide repeat protein n=1 Tax=Acidicapsa ligni TaxID=542300 RepID=UPI0021E0DF4A|nr:tetratricopeptide repeat protein [Acidicapsa ligni]